MGTAQVCTGKMTLSILYFVLGLSLASAASWDYRDIKLVDHDVVISTYIIMIYIYILAIQSYIHGQLKSAFRGKSLVVIKV